jgi:hypothetical protein
MIEFGTVVLLNTSLISNILDIYIHNKTKFMINVNWEVILKKGSKIGEIVLGVALALGILYAIIYFATGKNPIEKISKDEIKALQLKIDSVYNDQKFMTDRMYKIEANQIIFQEKINENNNKITDKIDNLAKLNKIYYEKIKPVNTYNSNQLDSFFKSRYKDYYDKQ